MDLNIPTGNTDESTTSGGEAAPTPQTELASQETIVAPRVEPAPMAAAARSKAGYASRS
jgi:hypothetical protein